MRNVLITGGSSGIGKSMVESFHANGDTVWFTYSLNSENTPELFDAYKSNPPVAFKLDLRDYQNITELVETLPAVPDVVIHNAGVGSKTVEKIAATSHEQDAALIQVNSIGTLWLNNLLYPPMVERGSGKIIFLSSVNGGTTQIPGFRHADGMSKAAIAFLIKVLAADLALSGVDVFGISPGATDTPMFQASTLNHLSPDERQKLIASLPKNRLIDPKEIAEVALFLASPAGRVLHGAVLDASLGLGVNPGLMQKSMP